MSPSTQIRARAPDEGDVAAAPIQARLLDERGHRDRA